jgi:hypothetical protein
MRLTATIGAAVALSALALAGCGGSGGNANASSGSDDEAGLKFAECMREHGVDVPDPQPGGGPIQLSQSSDNGPSTGLQRAGPLSDPEAQKAMKACPDELGDAAPHPPSAKEQQEAQDAALRFAQCMRDHGIDMPDPQFSNGPGGGMTMMQRAPDDADSPAFQKAQKACQDELPSPGPGGGPGLSFGAGPPSDSSD